MDADHPTRTADDEPERRDSVDEAEEESFPASDPPARTVVTGIIDQPLQPPDE